LYTIEIPTSGTMFVSFYPKIFGLESFCHLFPENNKGGKYNINDTKIEHVFETMKEKEG
jgi:hypothetical protein